MTANIAPEVLAQIEAARQRGVRVYLDRGHVKPCNPDAFDILIQQAAEADARGRMIMRQRKLAAQARARRNDLIEDIEWMLDTGERWEGICQRLDISPNTLERRLQRARRTDLIRRARAQHVGEEARSPRRVA